MTEPTLRQRLRYSFDNTMSKGTPAMIAWLGVATFGLLLFYAIPVWGSGLAPDGVEDVSLPEFIWYGLMRTLDAGTMGGDTGTWGFRFANLGITIGGIFVVSTLIGVLSSGLEGQLDELRKGRSMVVEKDHVVILGWSPSIFTVLSELSIANQNRPNACIVVLADKDKVEMEDEIRERVEPGKVRIVCRSGSPSDPMDLDVVRVQDSRAIVVLSPEGEDSDIEVIKTLLALCNSPNRRKEPYHIVAEVQQPRNASIARMVGGNEVEIILAGDLISRITVQTCRQNGLSVIHTELLDFGGAEIYFADAAPVHGKTFGEALSCYRTSSLLGILRGGKVQVLPPLDTKLQPGDQLIAISEDDDTVVATANPPLSIDAASITAAPDIPAKAERTLILGWNWRAPSIVTGLDAYVSPGSDVVLVAEEDHSTELMGAVGELKNVSVTFRQDDTTDRKLLDSLDIPSFDHIIVLCSDEVEAQRADARVLVSLLHLREIGEIAKQNLSIVSEMRDVRNRALAEVTQADDFIVSDRLVSLMLCQVAENKKLMAVLEDLFDPEGAEIYLKPASWYVKAGVEVGYDTVVEAARARGEIAIGYRLNDKARDSAAAYGVVVNPEKSGRVKFGAEDRVIVVSES